ncbi:MAG TPA: hypothetical protein VFQ63_03410 [Patescibacteria group bacterium]|nr:hypothetical protein [Patescibacteria group bacterium]
MITVPDATKKIVERSRYLTEAISKGLINYSSLARYIKPELEQMLVKPVSEAAILMALRRLEKELQPKFIPLKIFTSAPDMIVRSNLFEITVSNSDSLSHCYTKLLAVHKEFKSSFFTLTKGISETTIICSKDLEDSAKDILKEEKILSTFGKLSALTIRLPKEAIETPGTYYFFLKSLAWEGINLIEVVSTYLELTIILEEKQVHQAFSILQSLFN